MLRGASTIALAGLALLVTPAAAKDKIKIAAPHPTIITSTIPALAKSLGYFDRADRSEERRVGKECA